jgi:hypothetical protein
MQPAVLTKMEAVQPVVSKRSPSADNPPPPPSTASANVSVGKHEDEDNDQWEDSESLYEELLDDSEAYNYASGTF